MTNRILVAMFAICGSVLSFAPAFSQELVTKRVLYADLDLSRAEGRRTLQHRVDAAVSDVCGAVDPKALAMADSIRRCRAAASESARAQIAAIATPSQVALQGETLRIARR